MKNKRSYLAALLLSLGLMVFGVRPASAAAPANLDVQLNGPASAYVNSPYVYTVNIKNTGGQTASGVSVTVDLPLTDTSPNVFVLGTISGLDGRCSLVSNKLRCSLGNIRKNRTEAFSFNFAMPLSTKVLEIKAVASTTSSESNLADNTAAIVPTPAYADNQIVSATVLNSHCTGQNLTSYFECTLFPSSITEHVSHLDQGGTVSFDFPGYGGTWYQLTPKQLYFNYVDDNNVMVAEFNGFATSSTCFEGITTFPQNPAYSSPYKVCIQ